jgi:hypothetical protein
MGRPFESRALLVVACFSRHAAALEWGRHRLEASFGPVALCGEPFAFHHTAYYEPEMGRSLLKQLLAFRDLVPLDRLATIKRATIEMEAELIASRTFPEDRPLNLDPGLLTLGKFQLATTKDQSHRIYLSDGIFAEVTLRFRDGEYEPWPWTYADYREPFVRAWLGEAREYYKRRLGQEDSMP